MQTSGCKVFFIGFNKCGTTSLHTWLVDAGIRSFHGGGSEIDHHAVILANVARGRPRQMKTARPQTRIAALH